MSSCLYFCLNITVMPFRCRFQQKNSVQILKYNEGFVQAQYYQIVYSEKSPELNRAYIHTVRTYIFYIMKRRHSKQPSDCLKALLFHVFRLFHENTWYGEGHMSLMPPQCPKLHFFLFRVIWAASVRRLMSLPQSILLC